MKLFITCILPVAKDPPGYEAVISHLLHNKNKANLIPERQQFKKIV